MKSFYTAHGSAKRALIKSGFTRITSRKQKGSIVEKWSKLGTSKLALVTALPRRGQHRPTNIAIVNKGDYLATTNKS